MRESLIEQTLVRRCKALGVLCLKFTSPGRRSVPDRIVLAPGGHVVFVELKAPGKEPTPLQAKEHERLRALGFDVRIIDNKDDANAFAI